MKAAAAYLRVSSARQDADNQLPAIELLAEARGLEIAEVYSENESAWRLGHQSQLASLLSDIRTGKRKYDYLIIWSIDRLSRAGIGQIFGLIHTLRQYGVQVVSCKEPWLDSSGPAGELLLAVVAWVAEFESKRRSDRTRAGLDRAIANGKKLGRPRGAKDGKKRRRSGYLLRYANKGSENARS